MLNNKGFTIIELLGVIIVLIAITLVAVPSITSSVERNKNKIIEKNLTAIKNATEIYANLYKEEYDNQKFINGQCGISIKKLIDKDLITESELKENKNIEDYNLHKTFYNKENGTYEIKTEGTSC